MTDPAKPLWPFEDPRCLIPPPCPQILYDKEPEPSQKRRLGGKRGSSLPAPCSDPDLCHCSWEHVPGSGWTISLPAQT